MTAQNARTIRPNAKPKAVIALPPSKSLTNRALICAALADGTSRLYSPSKSDDSAAMLGALRTFGVHVLDEGNEVTITGSAGKLAAPAGPIDAGNAGTTFRFLTALAAIAHGPSTLTGDDRMRMRPIGELLDALALAGVESSSTGGYPPITVHGGNFRGGPIVLNAAKSSQFLSALLLAAPYAKTPVEIRLASPPSSSSYVALTLDVMQRFGVSVGRKGECEYRIGNERHYTGASLTIEADTSAATYFLAAAAITGGTVTLPSYPHGTLQGDAGFADVLESMGTEIQRQDDAVVARGRALSGISVDMNAMPDAVPALAVVAAFANGPTVIRNIAHLRYKESNRIQALSAELEKIGAHTERTDDGLAIYPGSRKGAMIETYNDHRIAMSFAVAGLGIPGVSIQNPACVSKSFPAFWQEFEKLESTE